MLLMWIVSWVWWVVDLRLSGADVLFGVLVLVLLVGIVGW